ncbi:MAG: glutaredoxin family protein [Actinomycetes bacterium]|tara:strand:- start:772 stop:1011 length:240 start_codon:yes stop_codon:yes gene_type:complete
MTEVTIYGRSNCHLCEVALGTINEIRNEFEFTLTKIEIDGNVELEEKYGEQVPVILINNEPHDFFRVDPERFRLALSRL